MLTAFKPILSEDFDSVLLFIAELHTKALRKAEYSDFRSFMKLETHFFPHLFCIYELLRQIRIFAKHKRCLRYIFDLKIEVKGQKCTFLLVLCFPKQNTKISCQIQIFIFSKNSYLETVSKSQF
jgi:hypothetical protein